MANLAKSRLKFLPVALLAALLIGVAGCGGGDEPATTTEPGATQTQSEEQPAGENEGDETAAGAAVFTANCGSCHTLAAAGTSGTTGPDLDDLKPDEATVKSQVENGGGGMPAFKDQLSAEEIDQVSAYVADSAGQ